MSIENLLRADTRLTDLHASLFNPTNRKYYDNLDFYLGVWGLEGVRPICQISQVS